MNFKRDLLREYIEMDDRIRELYSTITQHPNHKRDIKVYESYGKKKGEIQYLSKEVIIELDINLGDESILIMAHELMHYLLVLDGALLPVLKKENVTGLAEGVKHILMSGLTHHFLLKTELDNRGFRELQSKYSLSNKVHSIPLYYYFDEKVCLLGLFDRSTFAKCYDFDALYNQFGEEGLSHEYEMLKNTSKNSIDDINEISFNLIRLLNCEDELQLKSLDDYTIIKR
ncbi:hypothetical protein [Alkalihalobacterium elongatum]|uniref:hypothetical protein n=1 Tax=Alkalihalobacterium elongatum TaxID=2675466 RepID=UPI001C1F209D|nr:hypothetical protein [Alkalihalobacterium elongatum]